MEDNRGHWGYDLMAIGGLFYGSGEAMQYVANHEPAHAVVAIGVLMLAAGLAIWNHWDQINDKYFN